MNGLVLLNVWFPDAAEWERCIEAIGEPEIGAADLSPGLLTMNAYADRIPLEVARRIRDDLKRIAGTPADARFADSLLRERAFKETRLS
ncbi:hypothetical protein [Cryobacterium sp. Y29]|uniref:hypothetical protein n=1 Tax=Cryobacterium sp. Y29 TaxID=2048285 RepID=UPI000CE576EA|nr:hypothetical protein [Cryobacterium sp. Y29]